MARFGRSPKYKAVRTPGRDGKVRASKGEARMADKLILAYGRANIIEQVSIPIGDLRIVVDFMHILERFPDGSIRVRFKDFKGFMTPECRAKWNHLRDMHGIEIEVLTAKDAK